MINQHAGVKSIYQTVASILRGDADLKTLMGYDPKNPNIKRGYQTIGQWKKLLVFYFQPDYVHVQADFSPKFRQNELVVSIYNRDNELDLYDIGERVIMLLDSDYGAQLSVAGKVTVFDCSYVGELISSFYNDQVQANQRALRFTLTFRKED